MFKQINILILLATALFANEYKVSHKCTLQNCTKELQSIINSQKYNKILFPKGNFLLSALKLKSNLILEGKGKDKTILVFIKSKERSLINIEGENNIIIQKLQIKNFSEKSIINIYGKIKKSSNITILNNKIINYVAKDSIELQFDVDNIKIINNQMFYKTDIAIKRNWKQISHIKYRGRVSNNKSNFRLIIKDNYLEKGNCGFRIVTKGLPLSNIIFKNNHLNKQNSAGVSFYHGRDVVIEGNLFENITAVKMKNNDSGVVWLDRYRNGKIIFKNNIIKNCKGNAIFVEELKNSKIINNKIIN
ncbi:MAG: right-handed parallel beta-helix repeat-containing protein, partial [Sulfurovaceae bacterium]|nr:right-handed parallel beta-helix repeat-containing protein [Sulfurovaceae bacterium]